MIGRVERGDKVRNEGRHDLSSTRLDAEAFADAVHTHWPIENRLRWTLDAVFHGDLVRLRSGHGPENMAIIRHCVLNLVRAADDKYGLKIRRKKANLDTAHLAKPLASARPST